METTIIKKQEYVAKFQDDKRWIAFHFSNGTMVLVESNLPHKKSHADWSFYQRAIRKMLTVTKDFYADQLELLQKEKQSHGKLLVKSK